MSHQEAEKLKAKLLKREKELKAFLNKGYAKFYLERTTNEKHR